jgi:hypothetical protein
VCTQGSTLLFFFNTKTNNYLVCSRTEIDRANELINYLSSSHRLILIENLK